MIDNIELKNFRKFKHLPELNFSDINLFVGGNNAGKSTLAKAIILVLDNLMNMKSTTPTNIFAGMHPSFDFSSDLHDLHIGSFDKAFCKYGKKEEGIVFKFLSNGTSYEIHVNQIGDRSFISELILRGEVCNTEITFNFEKGEITINADSEEDSTSKSLAEQKKSLEMRIAATKAAQTLETNLENAAKRQEEIVVLQSELSKLEKNRSADHFSIRVPLTLHISRANQPLVANLLESLRKYADSPVTGVKKSSKAYSEQKANKDLLKKWFDEYSETFLDGLDEDIRGFDIAYVPAHAASQKMVFSAKDTSDYLSQTIHEFYKERIVEGDAEYSFIMRWLGKEGVGETTGFDIADSFKINNIEEEAYTFNVYKDGETYPLASMGMGSVQVVILLLKLATIWRRSRLKDAYGPLIFLEEPEQNLHPNWQSKLLDVFLDFNKSFDASLADPDFPPQMFIETHSEYLVRRSEVLVAESQYASEEILDTNCPFMVLFFQDDDEEPVYEMQYSLTGRFEGRKFGQGFYDEAGRLALTLSKLERRRNSL